MQKPVIEKRKTSIQQTPERPQNKKTYWFLMLLIAYVFAVLFESVYAVN
jgi:hypothetical protein